MSMLWDTPAYTVRYRYNFHTEGRKERHSGTSLDYMETCKPCVVLWSPVIRPVLTHAFGMFLRPYRILTHPYCKKRIKPVQSPFKARLRRSGGSSLRIPNPYKPVLISYRKMHALRSWETLLLSSNVIRSMPDAAKRLGDAHQFPVLRSRRWDVHHFQSPAEIPYKLISGRRA
jgi:hypothetical protein